MWHQACQCYHNERLLEKAMILFPNTKILEHLYYKNYQAGGAARCAPPVHNAAPQQQAQEFNGCEGPQAPPVFPSIHIQCSTDANDEQHDASHTQGADSSSHVQPPFQEAHHLMRAMYMPVASDQVQINAFRKIKGKKTICFSICQDVDTLISLFAEMASFMREQKDLCFCFSIAENVRGTVADVMLMSADAERELQDEIQQKHAKAIILVIDTERGVLSRKVVGQTPTDTVLPSKFVF